MNFYNKTYLSKTQNDSTVSDLLETYLNSSPRTGYLTFEVYQDSPIRGRLPISNAKITVSKLFGDESHVFNVVTTNNDGETEPIALPTVSRDLSLTPRNERVYAIYHVRVEAPNFLSRDIYNVQIFEDITSIQRVVLQPNTENNQAESTNIFAGVR